MKLLLCLIALLLLVGTVSADTLLVYANTDADGRISRTTTTPWETYYVIRGGAGNTIINTSVSYNMVGLGASTSSTKYLSYIRFGWIGDTSAIPDGATITSANFSVWGVSTTNGLGSINVGVTGFTPTSNNYVQISDYNKYGGTRYASDISYASLSTTGYNNFTFTAAGLANISKTGYTPLMMRFSQDIDNVTTGLVWASSASSVFNGTDTSSPGTTNDPFLEIIYTPAVVASFTCTKNFLRAPTPITCTDTSTNTPTSWSWNMGDGSAAVTTQNVTYQYPKRGSWGITLNATNAGGSNTTPAATNVRVVGYENYW